MNTGALAPQGAEETGYEGYLWDYFVSPVVVSERAAPAEIERAPSDVYVMWDLHAGDRVASPDYFRFPLGTVLRVRPSRLLAGQRWLPEDLYVFDDSMAWSVALTHEWIDDARYCLAATAPRAQP